MDFTNSFWLLNPKVPTNDDVSTRKTIAARRVLIMPVVLSKKKSRNNTQYQCSRIRRTRFNHIKNEDLVLETFEKIIQNK